MKYVNAKILLPDILVEKLQGGYIYIPAIQKQRKCWGELSGYREDGTRFNDGLVCDLKKDLDSNSFLGWHL